MQKGGGEESKVKGEEMYGHLKKICPASSHETCQLLKISPEWVTGPEQGTSSGRIATFSLWTGVFRDGISSIPDATVIPMCHVYIYTYKCGQRL